VSEVVFRDRDRAGSRPEAPAPAAVALEPSIGMQSVSPIAQGTWSDLLAVLGCKPSHTELITGDVSYRPDGRVRSITLNPGASDACRSAATVLFTLTSSRQSKPAPADLTEMLIAYFDPDVVPCGDEVLRASEDDDEFADADAKTRPNVQPPKRTRYREPVYPEAEQKARREGVVVLDAILSRAGCVQHVRLTRSVSPNLDLAAMAAVLAWKYSPTVVNGTPMRVVMNTSVNFSLR
jgi:TonB family protein